MFAFTYSGLHAVALRQGRAWFEKPSWPPLVLWWHRQSGYPDWTEGVRRHEHLYDRGPSPEAFSFRKPYDESGAPTKLDKARIHKLQLDRVPS